jgi:hypothetical protein
MRTLALAVATIAALLAAGALVVALSDRPPPRELAELRAQLDEERQARERLAERVRSLGARLAAEPGAPDVAAQALAVDPDPARVIVVDEVRDAAAASPEPTGSGPARGTFDEQALHDLGLAQSEVVWLHDRWQQRQLDGLYVRDRALREGWSLGRIRDARQRQRQDLVEEIGAGQYDLMLWATGHDNRVVVRDVYTGSAGEASGLRAGDVFVAYAGVPIFEPRDLRYHTTSCEAGLRIAIQVVRGGRLEDASVECGPLGVSTRRRREQPVLR